MNIKKNFSFSSRVGLAVFLLAVVSVAFTVYALAEKRVDRANELRYRSILLVHELRQSSDDLTRMARTYVVTGNPAYKKYYQDILAIREGRMARPAGYQNIYWDFVFPGQPPPRTQSGQRIPLMELMRQSDFGDAELRLLSEAKESSDRLTSRELAAMELADSAAPDDIAKRDEARLMLHDTQYHQAKSEVMRPLYQLNEMLGQRMQDAVLSAEDRATALRILFILSGLAVLYVLWRNHASASRLLGAPVDEVHAQIVRLGRGDFSSDGTPPITSKDSVLGWLAETRQQLSDAESARRQAEIELGQYRLHLEQMVEERTQDLSAAKEAAEAASRAKTAFLANMSHELRTPMNAIMGMTDLALHRASDPKQQLQLGKVVQASQHLLAVINDILDISRIEAQGLKLECTPFVLGEVMENLRSMVAGGAATKGVHLSIDLPPELSALPLLGDPVRLGQILLNLAGNALKFTDTGSITIRLTALEMSAQELLLRGEVRDTGIGIPLADQARLFTAFEQADGSMNRRYGGTGLGLAISKRLAAMMGGSIGFDSEVGVGSCFWFTARFAINTRPMDARAGGPGVSAEMQLRSLGVRGRRILLVEDEPVNQEVSRALLERAGLQVDLAGDGREAVELAGKNQYDLILMDMQMPIMNGIDATRAIRAQPGRERLPILALTANAFDEDRQRCLDAGMNDHIGKPVDPSQLFATLLKWLAAAG